MSTKPVFVRAISGLLAIILITSLAACGGGAKSTPRPTDTPVPTPTPVPTDTPVPPTPEETAGADELDSLISHLALLAPVHVVSVLTQTEGDNAPKVTKTEADIDAAGNQRIRLYDGDTMTADILFVDKQMYMGTGENQYVALGPQDDPWIALTIYGGAFLLMFNNLQEAEFVGREQANGFSTNKYRVQIDLSQFGLSGLIAGQQGAVLDYEGFAWVEMNAKALVKAQVLYRAKSTTDEKVTEIRTEFDAVRADVAPIETPTNVIGQ